MKEAAPAIHLTWAAEWAASGMAWVLSTYHYWRHGSFHEHSGQTSGGIVPSMRSDAKSDGATSAIDVPYGEYREAPWNTRVEYVVVSLRIPMAGSFTEAIGMVSLSDSTTVKRILDG